MPESLKRFDVNKDGIITREEVQSVLERERNGVNGGPTTPASALTSTGLPSGTL